MSRIVIFANGILSEPDLLRARLRPADRIFCADGGTHHALALDLIPEAIIGDLDSLSSELVTGLKAKGVAIHDHPAYKDQTDLELAFEVAIAEQPEEILLLTALGGRLDQMLANILLLTRPEYAGTRLSMADGCQTVTLLRSHQALTIAGRPGDTLSLVPLTATVTQVTFSGVEWPLDQVTLSLGSTWSISNILKAPEASVQIGEGILLVVQIDQDYEDKVDSRQEMGS